jgi:hypothetical protein
MTTTIVHQDEFAELVDQISLELFTKEQWEEAGQFDDLMGTSDSTDMLCQVLDAAFERNPDVFESIQWINSDYGFPLWVRPGVEWEPENDDDDDWYE